MPHNFTERNSILNGSIADPYFSVLKTKVDSLLQPLYKNRPANYRPISLTSTCCKMLEHIILSVLCGSQHGFHTRHSCKTQLIDDFQDCLNASNHILMHQFWTLLKLLTRSLTVSYTKIWNYQKNFTLGYILIIQNYQFRK